MINRCMMQGGKRTLMQLEREEFWSREAAGTPSFWPAATGGGLTRWSGSCCRRLPCIRYCSSRYLRCRFGHLYWNSCNKHCTDSQICSPASTCQNCREPTLPFVKAWVIPQQDGWLELARAFITGSLRAAASSWQNSLAALYRLGGILTLTTSNSALHWSKLKANRS